jgi:ring-1,2-phenylacetyl-CoA epoxidase subunit PaaD
VVSGARAGRVAPSVDELERAAAAVPDPELGDVTIGDLGVLRWLRAGEDGHVEVGLTPTYSGCPAFEAIEADVREALLSVGARSVSVRRVLAPAWTTDWISEEGLRKLAAGGIAPPARLCRLTVTAPVRCPHCGSAGSEIVSRFSSTACKELRRCRVCAEPFDHFKPL